MTAPVLAGQPDPTIADPASALKLVVGLGNPGPEYAGHRHNLGYRVVDALAAKHGLAFERHKGKLHLAVGKIAGHPVVLAKPRTFMNLSGTAVARASRQFGVRPEEILVVYDDLDLPLGRLRLRPAGGSGGHKGMRSIIDVLGTQSFARLRVGIGRPPGRKDPADYVLEPFTPEQEAKVSEVVQQASEAVESYLADGLVAAMEEFNRLLPAGEDQEQETQV